MVGVLDSYKRYEGILYENHKWLIEGTVAIYDFLEFLAEHIDIDSVVRIKRRYSCERR